MNLKKCISSILSAVCALTCVASGFILGNSTMTEAASFNYPVQKLRFGISDTNRSISITEASDGASLNSSLMMGTENEKWYLNYISAGTYEIVNAATGYIVTNNNGKAVLAPDTGGSNQRWNITAVQQDSEGYDLYYKVTSAADSSKALTFTKDGNAITTETYSGADYQKFKLNLDGLEGYAANCMVDGNEKAGTIGGLLGETVFVDTDDELKSAMLQQKPLTIVLTKDLDWHPYGQQEIRSDKTLIGAYGVTLKDAQIRTCPNDTNSSTAPSDNLVFKNLRLLAKDSTNCMLFNIYSSRQIWIDHCSFVSELPRSKDEVGKFIWCNSPFDGAWKSRATDFMTISYCTFYNRYWTTLFASVSYEVPDNEKIRCRVSFLYCFYDNCVRRCPQLGSAYGHIVSSFWRGKSASETDGIDQIIGGGQTDVVSQNCRFESVASGHEICAGGGPEPYRDDGSYTAKDANSTPTALNFKANVTSTRHPETENYGYSLINAVGTYNTKDFCLKYSGSMSTADAFKYITDAELSDWVAKRYPCPFTKDIDVSDSKQGAVMNTDVTYVFENVNSGLYLEVAGAEAVKGANVQQGSTGALGWKLVDAGNGYYYVYSEVGDGQTYCLDLNYAETDNGTNVGVWTNDESDARKFKFIDNGDGTFAIVTKCTNDASALGVTSASKDEAANVVQWQCNDSADQKWIAKVRVNSELMGELLVNNTAYLDGWKIDSSIAIGDLVFNDRDVTYTTLPSELVGAEAVLLDCDAKNVTSDLATLKAGADMTLYVGLDARVSTVPSWLSGWTKTSLTATNNKGVTFNLYSLEVNKGDKVTLGTNGQSASCVNYTVFAVKAEEPTTEPVTEAPTTEPVTEPITEAPTTEPVTEPVTEAPTIEPTTEPVDVKGDVNGDGKFTVADVVMLQNWFAAENEVTVWEKGDLDENNIVNVFDVILMRRLLLNA